MSDLFEHRPATDSKLLDVFKWLDLNGSMTDEHMWFLKRCFETIRGKLFRRRGFKRCALICRLENAPTTYYVCMYVGKCGVFFLLAWRSSKAPVPKNLD